jgi:hypothetical protein
MANTIEEMVETFKNAALTDPHTSIKAGLIAVIDKHVGPMLAEAWVDGFGDDEDSRIAGTRYANEILTQLKGANTMTESAREVIEHELFEICGAPEYGVDTETTSDRILAALSAAGFAIVPVEPTEGMLRAGRNWSTHPDGAWRNMLTANAAEEQIRAAIRSAKGE